MCIFYYVFIPTYFLFVTALSAMDVSSSSSSPFAATPFAAESPVSHPAGDATAHAVTPATTADADGDATESSGDSLISSAPVGHPDEDAVAPAASPASAAERESLCGKLEKYRYVFSEKVLEGEEKFFVPNCRGVKNVGDPVKGRVFCRLLNEGDVEVWKCVLCGKKMMKEVAAGEKKESGAGGEEEGGKKRQQPARLKLAVFYHHLVHCHEEFVRRLEEKEWPSDFDCLLCLRGFYEKVGEKEKEKELDKRIEEKKKAAAVAAAAAGADKSKKRKRDSENEFIEVPSGPLLVPAAPPPLPVNTAASSPSHSSSSSSSSSGAPAAAAGGHPLSHLIHVIEKALKGKALSVVQDHYDKHYYHHASEDVEVSRICSIYFFLTNSSI